VIDGAVQVLLVEDDPSDIELTLHAFRRSGLANPIRIARDGAEAIELLLGADHGDRGAMPGPDLVLLDLKLPKLDGLEVLRRVRSDARTRDLPVVVLSSSKEDRALVECRDLGVDAYVVKPVDFAKLAECTRALGFSWVLLNRADAGGDGA
jgi:two-component system, response regulator